MNKNRDKIVLCIGIALISFVFWNRFFRKREGYFLADITLEPFKIIGVLTIILIFTLLLGKTFYNILVGPKEDNKLLSKLLQISWVRRCVGFLEIYILKAPEKVYEIIYAWPYYPVQFLSVTTISYIVAYCYYPKTKYPLITSSFLIQIPRLLWTVIFTIDICYSNQIVLSIKYSWLLVIPLITNTYLYICEHNSKRNIEYFDLHTEFYREDGDEQCYIRYKTDLSHISNPMDTTKITLATIANWYYIYSNIRNYIKAVKEANNKIRDYMSLIIYPLLIISWSYYLFYILLK